MKTSKRYEILDCLRGATLISMICYHLVWDLVYIEGMRLKWYRSDAAYIWQQSICWVFILLSGFCWSLGRKKLRRGMIVFGAGILITLVTCLITPHQRVIFGILTLLGSCMLLMIPIEKICGKVPPLMGAATGFFLFIFTKEINTGSLGIGNRELLRLPAQCYKGGYLMCYLGMPNRKFFSTDYFSLFPWLFLFLTGYYLYRLISERHMECLSCPRLGGNFLSWLGRHSLIIYLLHQPLIYGVLLLAA